MAELAVTHIAKCLETNGSPAGEDIVAPRLVIRGTTDTAGQGLSCLAARLIWSCGKIAGCCD